jgi:indole-3-acetate monooxygenase
MLSQPDIREPLDEATRSVCEQLRELAPELALRGEFPLAAAELLSDSGLVDLCVPGRLGGRGQGLTDLVTVVERVAAVDASSGWCLFIMATAPWLLCHASDELIAEVYGGPTRPRIAGALAPTGTIRHDQGALVLDGRWSFASAATACDWVAVHAVVAGQSPARSVFVVLPTSSISYHEPWDGMGLVSSGSGAFGVTDLVVPRWRVIDSMSGAPRWPEPTFRIPFRATFAACAAVLLGIARETLEGFADYARTKRPTFGEGVLAAAPHIAGLFAECWGSLQAARASLNDRVAAVEHASASGGSTQRHQAELRIAMNIVRSSSLSVVDRLHHAAGGQAALHGSRFSQLLRDAHTASQHHMFSAEVTNVAGAALLGQPIPEGKL